MNVPANRSQGQVTVKARGFEEPIDRAELIMPRAKIVQSTSAEADKVSLGSIVNNITGDVLPNKFIPIMKFTQVIKFNSRDPKSEDFDPNYEPGAYMWLINDPNDHRWEEGEFGPDGEKPKAIKTINFLSLFEGQSIPVVLSFFNTSFKAGKRLLSLAVYSSMATKKDMFANKYALETTKTTNDKGTFYVLNVSPSGESTEEEFKLCESIYTQFQTKTKDIKVDITDENKDEDKEW